MKLEIPKMDRLVKDKNVLYVIFFLAVCNVLGYLTVSNFDAVVLFLVVGFLTTYFSKNMIIVLLVSMITTNLFVANKKGRREGMENKEDAKEVDKASAAEDQPPGPEPSAVPPWSRVPLAPWPSLPPSPPFRSQSCRMQSPERSRRKSPLHPST